MKLRKNCSELLVLCCWGIFAVSVAEVSAGTGDDSVTVGVGGKVLIEGTANDSGAVTIEITDDPEIGTAVIRPGNRILYHHTGAATGTDTLRYTVRDSSDSLVSRHRHGDRQRGAAPRQHHGDAAPGSAALGVWRGERISEYRFLAPHHDGEPARRPEAAIRRRAGRENLSHPGHQRAHRDQEGNEAQRRHEIQLPVMVHAAHSGDKHGFLDPGHGRPSLAPHRAQKLPSFASPTNAGPGATGHSVCKMDFSLSKF